MTDRKKENLKIVCRYLPSKLCSIIEKLPADRVKRLCEIRIRADKPITLIFTDGRTYLTNSGRFTTFASNELMKLTADETESVFNAMCQYSVHSLSDDIASGFITLDGGNRVGVYGRAVTDGGRVVSVRNIRGMNIRISGDFISAAEPLSGLIECDRRANILICGPPSSGKTTVLKDYCRILSDKKEFKVCLVDERSEADGCNIGMNTDVLSGYPKAQGIQIAVRTLSPDIIAFDEIGTADEISAVIEGLNSGVNFVMTVHCFGKSELVKKPQFRLLQADGAVDYCVFLKNIGEFGEIISAKELENEGFGSDSIRHLLCSDRSVHSLKAEYACANA